MISKNKLARRWNIPNFQIGRLFRELGRPYSEGVLVEYMRQQEVSGVQLLETAPSGVVVEVILGKVKPRPTVSFEDAEEIKKRLIEIVQTRNILPLEGVR